MWNTSNACVNRKDLEWMCSTSSHSQTTLFPFFLWHVSSSHDSCDSECDGIIIGLPVTANGALHQRRTDSQQGRRCRNFADVVSMVANPKGIATFLANETGSTLDATELMRLGSGHGKRRKTAAVNKDSVAAAIILSTYFEDPEGALHVKGSSKSLRET